MAPITMSSCGPAPAIMPGKALARKPRISESKATRSGVAKGPPRDREMRMSNCSSPAIPTVAAMASAASDASHRLKMRAIITAIKAPLNNSGANAVSAKRPCAFNSAIVTAAGPGKAGRQCRDDPRHQQAGCDGCRNQPGADGAEYAAGKGRGCEGASGLFHSEPDRHQRIVQCTFRQQPPHDVDELKRNQKSIGHGPRAKQGRDHGVARKTEQARDQRPGRDREKRANHGIFYITVARI